MCLTSVYSIIMLTYPGGERQAQQIGLVELSFGIGEAMGPVFGSLLYREFGYQTTFMVFGIMTTLFLGLFCVLLPDHLNKSGTNKTVDDGDLEVDLMATSDVAKVRSETQYNQMTADEVGLRLICDKQVALAYLVVSVSQIAIYYNASFVTLQFTRHYKLDKGDAAMLPSI